MATKNFSVPWTAGKTVSLTIKRKSDTYYWSGTAWQEAAATVEMTEVESLASGYSEYYSTTAPTSACFWWAIDDDSSLASYGEYDPSQTTSATESDIAPDTDDLKEFLQIPTTDEGDDTFLENCANRAGDYVEQYCGRRFTSSARTYILDGHGQAKLYLPDWPITAITSIYGPCYDMPRHFGATVTSSELVDSNYYLIGGSGGPDEGKDHILNLLSAWDAGQQNFEVIATTGYASLPSDLYYAALKMAVLMYSEGKHKRTGLTASSTPEGSITYFTDKIDRDVLGILNSFRRWAV